MLVIDPEVLTGTISDVAPDRPSVGTMDTFTSFTELSKLQHFLIKKKFVFIFFFCETYHIKRIYAKTTFERLIIRGTSMKFTILDEAKEHRHEH